MLSLHLAMQVAQWMEASTKVSKTAALSMDMGMAKRTQIGSVRSGRSQLFALPMEEGC